MASNTRFSDDFVPEEERVIPRRSVLRGMLVLGGAAAVGSVSFLNMRTAYAWTPPAGWHVDTTNPNHDDIKTPYQDHPDTHADSNHADIGHSDNTTHGDHQDGSEYVDAVGHVDQSPNHDDTPHNDTAHWDGGGFHQDGPHGDEAHGDSNHADTPHDDSHNHNDAGDPNEHFDHSDGYNHTDQHTDGGHADHSDIDETPHTDVPAHHDGGPGGHGDTHYDHWDHTDNIHGDR